MFKYGQYVLYISGKLETKKALINEHRKLGLDKKFCLYIVNEDKLPKDINDKPYLIYASIQDICGLQKTEELDDTINITQRELKSKFKFLDVDLIGGIIFDEAHFGSETDRTKQFLDFCNPKKVVYVTGTPFRIKTTTTRFSSKNEYIYDLLNEIDDFNNGKFTRVENPELIFLTPKNDIFDKNGKMSDIFNSENAYELLKEFFKSILDPDKSLGMFKLDNESLNIQNILVKCPNEIKFCKMVYDVLRGLSQIYNLRCIMASGTNLDEKGNRCGDEWYQKFESISKERNGKTFIITCGRGCQAITYKHLDAVLMLDDTSSPELYIQTAYRCKNPDGDKTCCYVIDYKKGRVLDIKNYMVQYHLDRSVSKNWKEEYEKCFEAIEVLDDLLEKIDYKFKDIYNQFINKKINFHNIIGSMNIEISNNIYKANFDFQHYLKNRLSQYLVTNESKRDKIERLDKLEKIKSTEISNKEKNKIKRDLEKVKQDIIKAINLMFLYVPSYIFCMDIKTKEEFIETIDNQIFYDIIGIKGVNFKEDILNCINLTDFQWASLIEKSLSLKEKGQDFFYNGKLSDYSIEACDKVLIKYGEFQEHNVIYRGGRFVVDKVAETGFDWHYVDENKGICLLIAKIYGEDKVSCCNIEEYMRKNKNNNIGVIGNPPYGDKCLPILALLTKIVVDENNGKIVSVQPQRFIQDPLWEYKKSPAKKYIPQLEGRVKSIDLIPSQKATEYFGGEENTTINMDLGIFLLEQGGSLDLRNYCYYRDGYNLTWCKRLIQKDRFIFKKYNSDMIHFVPIKTMFSRNERKTTGNASTLITNDSIGGYYINKKSINNLTPQEEWDSNKHITRGNIHNILVAEFSTPEETINFYNSTRTNFFRFFVWFETTDNVCYVEHLPYGDDYTNPWDDKRFYDYFNITEEEQETINKVIKSIDDSR